MKKILALALIIAMGLSLAACGSSNRDIIGEDNKNTVNAQGPYTQNNNGQTEVKANNNNTADTKQSKILVVYFSREGNTSKPDNTDTVTGASMPTGNTHVIANQIHEDVGGDIFEIITSNSYSPNYDKVVEKALQEQKDDFRPELSKRIENLDSYNVIFLGYPNWWGTMPMAVFNFLEEYDFYGKTIIPFCTHEGSRLGRSVEDIKKACPQSTVLDGLAVRGSDAGSAQKDVAKWLKELGITK